MSYFTWAKTRRAAVASLAFWLSQILAAALSATPLNLTLARLTSALPRGDAHLFEPGGVVLMEVLRQHSEALGAAARACLLLLIVAACFKLIPLCSVMAAMSGEADRDHFVTRCSRTVPRFVLLGGIELLAHALLIGALVVLTSGANSALEHAFDERTEDMLVFTVISLLLIPHALVQVVLDLARSACARCDRPGWWALKLGLEYFIKRPFATSGRWLAIFCVGLSGPILAFLFSEPLDVHQPDAWRPWLLLTVHQLAFAWLVAARLAWLSWCTEYLKTAEGRSQLELIPASPSDTAERNVVTDAPTPNPDA